MQFIQQSLGYVFFLSCCKVCSHPNCTCATAMASRELKALAEYSMKCKSFRGNAISIRCVCICMTWLWPYDWPLSEHMSSNKTVTLSSWTPFTSIDNINSLEKDQTLSLFRMVAIQTQRYQHPPFEYLSPFPLWSLRLITESHWNSTLKGSSLPSLDWESHVPSKLELCNTA